MKISATTVMLPEYDLVQTCELLQRFGFDGVEWRVRRLAPGQENAAPSAWGRHLSDLSPENILSRAAEVKRVCADHGLGIAGFASACSARDREQVHLLAEGAQACGCPAIRLSCPRGYNGEVNYHELYQEAVDAYGEALEITRKYGVKVLVEMHGGTIHPSASLAYRIVPTSPRPISASSTTRRIWCATASDDSLAVQLLGDYLAHLRRRAPPRAGRRR